MGDLIPVEAISSKIYLIRGQKVMLDRDLAELYGAEVRALKQAVRRNKQRFPDDFMFELTSKEEDSLRSQIVILKGRGQHSKYLSFAFTEHGALMAASILKTTRAAEISIYVVRAFVKLREMISTQAKLVRKIEEMEAKYDENFQIVFETIKKLLETDGKPKRRIGF